MDQLSRSHGRVQVYLKDQSYPRLEILEVAAFALDYMSLGLWP